jgi:hypothetical protein
VAGGLNSPWLPLDRGSVARVAPQPGVYELATADGVVLFIGMAGGRSKGGLHGELEKHLAAPGDATRFRAEATTRYMSRYDELLTAYATSHGTLPSWNVERARKKLPKPAGA